MAVVLSSSNAGVYDRIGYIVSMMRDALALQGGSTTSRVGSNASFATRAANLETYCNLAVSVSPELDGHWQAVASWRSSQSTLFTSFRAIAEKILIRMVDQDAVLPEKTLTAALTELIRQMRASSDDVNGSTLSVGSQTTVAATGDPTFVFSLKNTRGDTNQLPKAETLRIGITGDAIAGTATARREPWSIKGAAAVSDVFSYLWPGGSGCSVTGTLVDAQLDNSGGNLLRNSDFETATTSNYFDDWTHDLGSAGTQIFAAGSSDAYTQSNALKLTGASGVLTTLHQKFNQTASTTAGAGGTPGKLYPSKQYAVNFVVKALSAAPVAGVLRVALVDSTDTVINDDFGTANSFTVDLTAITTSYVAYNGTFRTPTNMPSAARLQLKTTTAITNSSSVCIDDLAMTEMTRLYEGGPSVAGFAKATNSKTNDAFTVAISATHGAIAQWFERLFSMNAKGLVLPYDDGGTETLADTLFTQNA